MKTLVKLAKKMKKNNVSIDFIQIGEMDEDIGKKLTAFNENVKGGEGSHLVVIPPGPYLLSDQLLSTPIFEGGASGGGAAGAEGGAESFEFGIDPSVDPELALALRMSMEEEKSRQERQAKEAEKAALPEIKEEEEKDSEDNDKMDTA